MSNSNTEAYEASQTLHTRVTSQLQIRNHRYNRETNTRALGLAFQGDQRRGRRRVSNNNNNNNHNTNNNNSQSQSQSRSRSRSRSASPPRSHRRRSRATRSRKLTARKLKDYKIPDEFDKKSLMQKNAGEIKWIIVQQLKEVEKDSVENEYEIDQDWLRATNSKRKLIDKLLKIRADESLDTATENETEDNPQPIIQVPLEQRMGRGDNAFLQRLTRILTHNSNEEEEKKEVLTTTQDATNTRKNNNNKNMDNIISDLLRVGGNESSESNEPSDQRMGISHENENNNDIEINENINENNNENANDQSNVNAINANNN
eukprot:241442_1